MEARLIYYYLVPLLFIVIMIALKKYRTQSVNLQNLKENRKTGLSEPASLHPVIDPMKCLGCGSCASACPEGKIIGLVKGKAQLIDGSHCIGHGACKEACPMDAITLVFGTEKRGLDIPNVKSNFETNMPGIFIAGELGGMGLIRNAIEQGRQALDNIMKVKGVGKASGDKLDLVILGAGPAGFSASLGALKNKLKFVTLEQDTLGGTVAHFPRGKLVMTAPAELPMIGKVKFTETTKEELMDFWEGVEKKTAIKIHYQERVEEIVRSGEGYAVKTGKNTYETKTVLLAIGRRGTPRTLGVPGENLSKVTYRLIDAEQYRGQHVLVVGGGDSALEAATSIAEQPDTKVTLSYRSEAFSRAKEKNRQKVQQAEVAGQLSVLFKSNVKEIFEDKVVIEHDGQLVEVKNDGVIVSAGGILPTPFLKNIGIEVETKHGTA